MPSISDDLPLFHLWDYWDSNLRWSLQPDRIFCEILVISSSSNLPRLSGHPPLPGSQKENENNRDSQASLINNRSLTKRLNYLFTLQLLEQAEWFAFRVLFRARVARGSIRRAFLGWIITPSSPLGSSQNSSVLQVINLIRPVRSFLGVYIPTAGR